MIALDPTRLPPDLFNRIGPSATSLHVRRLIAIGGKVDEAPTVKSDVHDAELKSTQASARSGVHHQVGRFGNSVGAICTANSLNTRSAFGMCRLPR